MADEEPRVLKPNESDCGYWPSPFSVCKGFCLLPRSEGGWTYDECQRRPRASCMKGAIARALYARQQAVYYELVVDEDLSDSSFSERKLVTITDDGLSIHSQYRHPGETEWNYWQDQGDSISLPGLAAAFPIIEKAVAAFQERADRKEESER